MTLRSVFFSCALVLLSAGVMSGLAGCGSANVCQGNNCTCPSGETCAFGSLSGDCSLNCEGNTSCTGSCSGAATVLCQGTSCVMSGAAGSRFTCLSGTCSFTCNGSCNAFGGTVTCAGGTSATPAGCS